MIVECFELELKFVEVIWLSLSVIICFIGIVGNILVVIIIGVICVNKIVVYKYIFNLVVVDIGVLVICYFLIFVKVVDLL